MLSDPRAVWNDLGNNIVYKTYSGEKLAALYLKHDFSAHILSKVFEVLLDPLFTLEDITLKSVQDIFNYISNYRRENLSSPKLPVGRWLASPCKSAKSPKWPVSQPSVFPTDVVSIIVDKLVENRKPLEVASTEENWRVAYLDDVSDFHAMSLVHPSWTPIARKGLRCRAIAPYHQLDRFLVSPLCGPWVTEVIMYWTVNDGSTGVTDSNVHLFEALLKRVPNVHSLALNTSLVWPTYKFAWNTGVMPPLRVDTCLELVSNLSTSLENLRLNHFIARADYISYTNRCCHCTRDFSYDKPLSESLGTISEAGNLFALLPRMQSLKSLSLYGWAEDEWEFGDGVEIDWSEHPCQNLMAVELVDKYQLSNEGLNWLIRRRCGFDLRSLSISIRHLQRVGHPLPNLQKLRLYIPRRSRHDTMHLSNILESFDQLVNLDLFIFGNLELDTAIFPKNLEHITFHMTEMDLRWLLSRPIASYSIPLWPSSSNFVPIMKSNLPQMGRLQSLGLIGVSSVCETWRVNRNSGIEGLPVREIPRDLLNLCEEHNIKLICQSVTDD